ncbi:MAG: Ig-like domain-containing protein [bacterium]|nr:Ig-like domain-containing protein [bacterium]
MKWNSIVLVTLLLALLLGSCDRNPSSNPGGAGTGNIASTILVTVVDRQDYRLVDFRQVTKTLEITATVTDNRGAAISGHRVFFTLTKRPTTAASIGYQTVDTTNSQGVVKANLVVTIDTTETITVTARSAIDDRLIGTGRLNIILATDVIRNLTLNIDRSTIQVREGQRDSARVTARVTDSTGAPISGLTIAFSIDSSQYASLDVPSAVTNNFGEAQAWVRTIPNRYLDNIGIRATIVGMPTSSPVASRIVYLNVRALTRAANIMLYWANPNDTLIYIYPNEVINKTFVVVVTDSFGVELPNVPVYIRIVNNGIGSIPQILRTGATGRDSITWSNNGMTGWTYIRGSIVPETMGKIGSSEPGPVRNGNQTVASVGSKLPSILEPEYYYPLLGEDAMDAQIQLEVRQFPSISPTLQMAFVGGNAIYATGNDSLTISILLRDGLNQGIPNATVNLQAAYGAIPSSVTTDISGAAVVYLRDMGQTTPDTGALITARYNVGNVTNNIRYFIRPLQSLGGIRISGRDQVIVNPTDSVQFNAQVWLENGDPAYDGTRVRWFVVGRGRFVQTLTFVSSGSAVNYLQLNQGLGTDTIRAMAFTETDTVTAETYLVRRTGQPNSIICAPRNGQLTVNGPPLLVTAVVRDSAGNVIANHPVTWGTSVGTITFAGFDDVGNSTALLSASGANASSGFYWGVTTNNISDSVGFQILADNPRTLRLSADSLRIQVRGTGGYEHTIIRGMVRDGYGNAVSEGVPVRFTIINGNLFGPLPENRPYFSQLGIQTVDVRTAGNGEAAVTLSSGNRPGAVLIEAAVLDSIGGSSIGIVASLSNVQVVAGPPAYITVSWDRDNGTAIGGGIWRTSASALVTDLYTNPVANNIAVAFSVEPVGIASIDAGSTGNLNPNGQSEPGKAYTYLTFHGSYTLDTVTVTARCQSRDTLGSIIQVSGSRREALPLFNGRLQLNVQPRNFHFDVNNTDRAWHMAWAIVQDGYGHLVSRAPVIFEVQRGRLFATQANAVAPPNGTNALVPARRRTGNYPGYTDPNGPGAATLYIGATGPRLSANPPTGEVFLDPQTLESNSEVNAYVEGYSNITSQRVVVYYQRRQ